MKLEEAAALRKPYQRDSPKGQCGECGGYHGLPAVHLDYVGHAAVTDRLLGVDPNWTWEPLALDAAGLPMPDREGNLWIKLTICGVTRLGVGDGNSMKERIGDAIRNAAMRFGVALDLWSKEELEQSKGPTAPMPFSEHGTSLPPESAAVSQTPPTQPAQRPESPLLNTRSNLAKAMYAAINEAGITKDETPGLYQQVTGRQVESSKDLTDDEARAVLAHLDSLKDQPLDGELVES